MVASELMMEVFFWPITVRHLCPVFLTNLEGKVGKVGKVSKVGKVGTVGKVGKVGKEGRLRE
jgi:hypothetical protein